MSNLKTTQQENLERFELESKFFSQPAVDPPGTIIELNGVMSTVQKHMPNNLLPKSADVLHGLTAVLLAHQVPINDSLKIKIVASPEDDDINTGDRFRFLALIFPALLENVPEAQQVVYPKEHLQNLQALLFQVLTPEKKHEHFDNIPPWTRFINIRPSSINAPSARLIGSIAIPPEWIWGNRYDIHAQQLAGYHIYEETRLQLK
jgi:hypothetical protein